MPAFRPKQLPRLLLRALARGLLFLLWLWLALAAAFQLHLLASRDGTLPRPILRLLEARLAREDIHISLDGATLGPDGVFLLQNPVFASGPGGHPLASARLLLAKIDLRKLPLGRLDIGDLLVSGLDLTLPAMLSESGRDETVVSGADLRLSATRRLLRVHHLTAAAGPLRLSASGALALDAPLDFPLLPTGGRKNLVPALQQALRETARRLPVLDALENPSLVVRLAPDTGGIANVTAAFRADALVNPPEIPFPLRAGQPAARLETPLRQTAAGARSLNLSAARLELSPPGVPPFVLDGVHARAAPGTGLDLAAARLRLPSRQAAAGPLVAHAAPLTDDRLRARAAFLLAGATTRLSADVNIPAASASVRAETAFGNALVAFLDSQQLLPARLAPLVRFPDDNAPARLRLAFDLNGSPRPANLAARLHSGPVAVRGVTLAEASAAVSLDGSRLLCEPLLLRTDASLAAVSYEMDTASLRFRFLLDGRLRPDDIAPWFPAWWPAIWTRFQFPRETPSASVAIAGQWNA
ncbi:MAG: hypothetical protein LBR12_01780, partial [Opitutaceae bacterium]|nr:hypothetical protein [Opitutaceae bacterium]